jgi:transcriptional regulator with XRE-family HTH domain
VSACTYVAETDNAALGRRFRVARLVTGQTQAQVALLMSHLGCRLHQTAVAKIEAGTRDVSVQEAIALAYVTRVDLYEVLGVAVPPAHLAVRAAQAELASAEAELAEVEREIARVRGAAESAREARDAAARRLYEVRWQRGLTAAP